MPYRIKPGESARKAVRRIAREQIDAMQDDLRNGDQGHAVHAVRKRCKKLRGLIRLVRPAMSDTYQDANAQIRNAARTLAEARDATTIMECFDRLTERRTGDFDTDGIGRMRSAIAEAINGAGGDESDLEARKTEFHTRIGQIRESASTWKIKGGAESAFLSGLEATYRRARKDLNKVINQGTTESLHEWRKYVKYHWYQTRLIQRVWQRVMDARERELSRLADLLGEDHDLALLSGTVKGLPHGDDSPQAWSALAEVIDSERADFQAQALPLGRRLFAEKPSVFTKRVKQYWRAWGREERSD